MFTGRLSGPSVWRGTCTVDERFREGTMLRITAQNTPNQVTLKLEGSLAGTWVLELEDAWRATNSDRSLCLDLTAVDQVDSAGKYLLVLLRERGVRLVTS